MCQQYDKERLDEIVYLIVEVPKGTEADPLPDDAAERDTDESSARDQRNGKPSP